MLYFQKYKLQSKIGDFRRSSSPERHFNNTITQPRIGRFSNYHPKPYNIEEYTSYIHNYIYQDEPDKTNTAFYDSNKRKYKTRSPASLPANSLSSRTYNKLIGFKTPKKNSIHPVIRKLFHSINKKYGTGLIRSRFDNTHSERKISNEDKGSYINFDKMSNSEEREKIFQQIEKEKEEFLNDLSSSNKKGRAVQYL